MGEARSVKQPNTFLTRACADGLMQSETVVGTLVDVEGVVCVRGGWRGC